MEINFLKLMTALIPNVYLIFLIMSLKHLQSQAAVVLSPSEFARVCIGASLEFRCSVTGTLLEWSFPRVGEPQASRLHTQAITAEGPVESQTDQLIDNSTTYYQFIRTSAEGSPVSSRLLISAVSNSHNGTAITCSDLTPPTEETASTIIVIIDSQIEDLQQMSVMAASKFEVDGIKVTLEWISPETNSSYSYYVEVHPPAPRVLHGNSSVMLELYYNTLYNVSILAAAGYPCAENLTIFTKLFDYSTCEVPFANMTDNKVTMINYSETIAVVGSTITFTCLPGMEPKNATCTDSGEWKPQLSCANVTTESDVILEDSANISTITVLAGTFGAIFFVILIIVAALIFAAYSIRRAKRIRNMCPTSSNQNNSESKVTAAGYLVYADIGPSSFSNQQPRRQLHIPPIDDTPIEYAQIKHNCSQHAEKSKPKPTEFKLDINDSPELNVTLDNLLIQLRPQVTPVWYKFGEAAGIEKGVLDGFAKQCTPEDCVMEMLDCWLRNQAKQPTWRDVAKILKITDLPQLALEIEEVYVTGKLPVKVDMNYIPQPQVEREDPSNKGPVATESAPPRIPPKMNKSTKNPVPGNAVPALPPKPKFY